MATPARPRQSAIPGPGRVSAIPTPGRSRSSSSVYHDDMSQALTDALRTNDSLNHRNPSISNTASLSPQSITSSISVSRSVTGRPPVGVSSSRVQERSRTPSSARTPSRPASRQSDTSKFARNPEIGDNVRIESLGFEGTLRYIGAIEGKPGLWAGVELSGGFTGKGKNNGSVGGKQYFTCPDKCGVFVAVTKLSPPTVGPGAVQRPSSVASSRGGRSTPATTNSTGRITPSSFSATRTPSASLSNGRTTPAHSGRVTPSLSSGRVTPASSLTQKSFRTPSSKAASTALSNKITAGSRASKYITMTAKQLSSPSEADKEAQDCRRGDLASSTGSPSLTRTLSSPTRQLVSPFATPKAGHIRLANAGPASPTVPARSRVSLNTPRGRVPSSVAMPPPPFPFSQDAQSAKHDDVENNSIPMVSPSFPAKPSISSRPTSSASQVSGSLDDPATLEQLQSRLDAAEYENERLRAAADANTTAISLSSIDHLQNERQEAFTKYAELQDKFLLLEDQLASRTNERDALREENDRLLSQLSDATSQQKQAVAALQTDLEERLVEVESLNRKVGELESLIEQKRAVNEAQSLRIEDLVTKLEQSLRNFEEEKRELTSQVDELRLAGQETIALYEDKLSATNTSRYELEQRLLTLEASLGSSKTIAVKTEDFSNPPASFATQIDNEALQEQVQHLQKKTARLEEQLDEARATLERDVASYQDKMARIRVEEDQRKRDIVAKTRELEESLLSEARARNRVEEIEEALRESTVALENARGEVETLRTELANLEVLIDDATEGDTASKLSNFIKKISADRADYQREVKHLEQDLQEVRAENHLLREKVLEPSSLTSVGDVVLTLKKENQDLRGQIEELKAKLSITSPAVDDRDEGESSRKKAYRDFTPSVLELSKSPPARPEPSTEELAGLKHIIQELQKESSASTQRIKILESENALLSAEAHQLRLEIQNFKEHANKAKAGAAGRTDLKFPPPPLERKLLFEEDMDQLQKRLSDAEVKHARIVHDLNKEISELEALVESKIYREDELEQEIERLKDKISRQKKTSKNGSSDTPDNRQRLSRTSHEDISPENEGLCEICERPGHDIFNCSLLKDDTMNTKEGPVVCEDCESPGHIAADCPHSSDVF